MRSLEDAGDGFEFFVAELRLFAFRPDFGSFLGEWVGDSLVSVVMLCCGFLVVELVRQRSPFFVLLGQGCKV